MGVFEVAEHESESRGISPPSLVSHTSSVQIPQDEGAVLICIAQGCPQPDYRWYHIQHGSEAVFVLPGPRTRVLGPVLAIEAVSPDDAGLYKCTASNSGGDANAELQLVVSTPLQVEVIPPVQTVNMGAMAEFRCSVPSFHGSGLHLLSWYKNGRVFPGRPNGETLVISSVSREDRGMYQCVVRRAEGETAQSSAELKLGDAAPVLTYTFIEQTLQPGPEISLKCSSTGNPTPNIKWTLDGFSLPDNERFRIGQYVTAQGDVVSHTNISHVTTEDGGEYSCIAENRAGRTTHSARLNIYGLPYIRPIPKITAVAGEVLKLKCPVSGYPIEQISWEKDRRELPVDLRQKIMNGVLYIEPVEKATDSGTYTCSARNKQGQSARRSGEVFVIVPPKLNPIASHTVLNVGERASLTCTVIKGDLPLTISWSKDGHPFKSKQHSTITQVDQFNSILVIDNVTPHHSGNYSCIARNPVAEEIIIQHLMVNVPPSIEPFYFPTDGLQEGSMTRVVCGISRGDPPLEISWLKDGTPVSAKFGVNISTLDPYSSLLRIPSLTASHTGEYTCVAVNPAAQVRYSSKLQVKVPPRWITEPVDINVERNKHAVIDCQAEGVPTPVLLWKKAIGDKSGEYSEIRESSSTRILSNGSLLMQNVKENMEGYYLCQASNGIGNAIGKVIQVKVRSAPFFAAPSRTVSVKRGDTATLQCNVNGDKPITVKWIRNGKAEFASTMSNYRISIRQDPTTDGVLAEMQILGAESSDAGAYFCQASNLYGKEQQLVNLHVQEPPESPTDLKAVMVNSQAVNIQWQHHSSHEGEVSKYVVQYRRSEDPWLYSEVSSQLRGTLIEDLRPATQYRFRVIAEGSAGQSKPSEEIVVTTEPQKPSGPPINIQIQPISSTELVVTWAPPHNDLQNGQILGYNIGFREESSSSSSFNITKVVNEGDNYEEMILKNLQKYTRYLVVVQAFNQVGEGPFSEPITAQTLEDVPSIPPSNVLCTALSSQSLQVTWSSPPAQTCNGVLQGYKIQYDALNHGVDDYGIRKTTALTIVLTNLQRFTNYSIEILAFTKIGDGVYSKPIYCITEEDAPGPPDDIKVFPTSQQSLLISWLPPAEPNGIITKYNLYTRIVEGNEELNHGKRNLPEVHTVFEMKNLQQQVEYQFWITAVTRVGEGQSSSVVSQIASSKVPARISSFGVRILKPWHSSVTLSCDVYGVPLPRLQWLKGEYPIQVTRNTIFKEDGKLQLSNLSRPDSNNYTCTAQNKLGSDSVTYQLIIQVPPSAPLLYISSSTSNSILFHWKITDNGDSPITSYTIRYKRSQDNQHQISLPRRSTSHELKSLTCGSTYQVNMIAANKLGSSKPSNTLTVRTQGQKPGVPQRSIFISPNSTSVLLNLHTWPDNGCPILYFVIKYRQQNDVEWIIVSNSMKPQRKASITGLLPATEYHIQVEGHNTAGYSAGDFYFFTLTKDGEVPPPESVKRGELSRPFFMTSSFVVPALITTGFSAIVILVIALLCWKTKTREPRKNSYDTDQNLVAQRERFYATLQKVQEEVPDKIPESASEISPYATFQLGDGNNTLLHSIMYQDRELMEGAPTPETTICKTRRVRRRSNRRPETTLDTDESDSDMDQPASSRTESSNQLDINMKNKNYIYHGAHSSTSSDISPRWLVPNKSFRSSSVVESSFHNRPEANENECDLDTMKKLKLGARSSLWLRPTGRKGDHTDYSIAV
ncbi:hypothetical protein V9T40_010423 [Parthenolecanium corni]|uniref:Down syndrome cell adhesion molecule-like protein Dscam2 n=1 Tax=Parthenolecanium corni TaxID=536013 RepID=A0AAN9TPU6_9HEMI